MVFVCHLLSGRFCTRFVLSSYKKQLLLSQLELTQSEQKYIIGFETQKSKMHYERDIAELLL